MKRLLALIEREYWENKGAFRTTPLVIGCIYIALLLMSIFTTAHIDNELYTFKEAVRLAGEQPVELRAEVAQQALLGSSVLFRCTPAAARYDSIFSRFSAGGTEVSSSPKMASTGHCTRRRSSAGS